MARYIDAEALYNKLYPLDLVDKKTYAINAKAVADAIAKTPTAENVAEVVFCQDCKYAQRISDEYGNIDFKCRKMNDYMSPVDFCSRGERKEKT
jgi:hypothetical protein